MLSQYLERVNSASRPTTLSALRSVLRLFVFTVATPLEFQWAALTPESVALLRSALAKRYSPATANKVLAILRSLVQNLGSEGQIEGVLAASIARAAAKVPGGSAPRGRMLSQAEIDSMTSAAGSDRNRALILVAVTTGLRRAELSALGWQDVDEESACLTVRHGKGGKRRVVYLPDVTMSALRRIRRAHGPVFASARGRLGVTGVWYVLRQAARRAQVVPSVTPHDFRRTFASLLLDRGVDLATVQVLMGHANPLTTSKYDRRGDQRLVSASRVFDAANSEEFDTETI